MVLLQRKLYFSKDPEGVQHFQGGSTFSRGIQMLISIEAHITCDFPGGGGGGGGVQTTYLPSGSAHVHISLIFGRKLCAGCWTSNF